MASEKSVSLKQATVKEITDKIKDSESVILFSYQGLSVADMSDLRRQLRSVDADIKIYKNTLTKRALDGLNVDLTDFMEGPNALLFGKSLLEPIKVIADFAKKQDALQIRVGVLSGNVADINVIKEYASIPSREGLLTMIASGLLQYLKEFAIGVDMIAKQKEE